MAALGARWGKSEYICFTLVPELTCTFAKIIELLQINDIAWPVRCRISVCRNSRLVTNLGSGPGPVHLAYHSFSKTQHHCQKGLLVADARSDYTLIKGMHRIPRSPLSTHDLSISTIFSFNALAASCSFAELFCTDLYHIENIRGSGYGMLASFLLH